jgi:hypothetical protein
MFTQYKPIYGTCGADRLIRNLTLPALGIRPETGPARYVDSFESMKIPVSAANPDKSTRAALSAILHPR